MRNTKQHVDIIYLFLTLVIIAVLVPAYLILGPKPKENATSTPVTISTSKNQDVDVAKIAVAEAEANISQATIDKADDAITQLGESAEAEQLKMKINNLKTELDNQTKAETAVAEAERLINSDAVAAAQTLVDKVTQTAKKEAFQKRLEAVTAQFTNFIAQ